MRPLTGGVALLAIGLGVFEVVMKPTSAERVGVGLVLGLMALTTAVAATALPRLARRQRSLRLTVAELALISLVVVAVGLGVAGQQMFISDHDLGLLLTVVGFGVASGMFFAVTVSRPLTEDLTQISDTAKAIAAGDLGARTGLTRSDEIGDLAGAIDVMAGALEAAQSMRVRDEKARREFFAAAGHDLRTPLASLKAALEATQDGVADDPSRYMASMERDVDALSRLVEDLFLLARIEAGDFEVARGMVDLTEVADETMEVFRPIAHEKQVELRLSARGSVVATASVDAVSRVMRNLVDNAIRHSPRGGEVVISVSNGGLARVIVADEGDGFSDDFASRAFDRFSRGDSSRRRGTGGSGLGLAIAKGFVSALEGRIWAAPGPGGRVEFTLPLGEPSP